MMNIIYLLMKELIPALLFASLMVVGISICPLPLAHQTNIFSDAIHVLSNDHYKEGQPMAFDYNFRGTFRSRPKTVIGINSFQADPSSVMGFEITITEILESGMKFRVSTNENFNWKEMRFNFLSTTRADLEFGYIIAPTPIHEEAFSLNYTCNNTWSENSYLKVKVFLRSIIFESTNGHNVKIHLDTTTIQLNEIILAYSSRNSSSLIRVMSVDLVIFDAYNPAFRYAEGVFSQNYVNSQLSLAVSSQGVAELQTYIVGITSFQVNTNTPISLFSSMGQLFYLEIGSKTTDCVINHITVSYLILSVFQYCGACREYILYDNGTCVKQCPLRAISQNGQCIPINCSTGQAYNKQSFKCEHVCDDIHAVWSNEKSQCICIEGYFMIEGICGQCKNNQVYFEDKCVCALNYQLLEGFCVRCRDKYVFSSGRCVCAPGFYLIGGECAECDQDSFYSPETLQCVKKCKQNQLFSGQGCVCLPGYIRNSKQICSKIVIPACKQNQVLQMLAKICICKPTYTLVNGICQKIITCKDHSYWDGVSCNCVTGYRNNQVTGQCEICPPTTPICSANSYFNGFKCVCQDNFFKIFPGVCGICPPSMSWNGRKCAYKTGCWEGYVWSFDTECCIPIAASCGPNSQWNGAECTCLPGYNQINSQCIRCSVGFQFDGSQCVYTLQPIICEGRNQIAINGQCVCRNGYHLFNRDCIRCPSSSSWNGVFCDGINQGCMSTPYSLIKNQECICMQGYHMKDGICKASAAVIGQKSLTGPGEWSEYSESFNFNPFDFKF